MKIESRKIIIAILMSVVFASLSYAQSGDDVWKNLVVKETDNYKFSVPASWRLFDRSPGTNPEHLFEASGMLLPETYNNAPVIVTIWIAKMEAGNLKEAKEKLVKDYRAGADRVFAEGFSHEEETAKLKSGERASLLNTRFYRKSRGLHQSRYDLVVYSPKAKSAYLYTMSVQYYDAEYKFEQKYELKKTAKKLYENFQLKGKTKLRR